MTPQRQLRFFGFALALSALSAGCATYGTMLINPGRHLVNCRSTGGGAVGVAMASSNHDTCVRNYKAAGYRLLSEAGVTGIANVTDAGNGVRILKIADNSPASRSGLAPGDVIAKVNSQPVTKSRDAMTLLFGQPGEKVEVTLTKDGQEKPVTIILDSYEKVYGTGR